jgi:hypothetical protein
MNSLPQKICSKTQRTICCSNSESIRQLRLNNLRFQCYFERSEQSPTEANDRFSSIEL